VRHDDLLSEPVVAVRPTALAFTAPDPDQGEQSQQRIVKVSTLAQVGGVGDGKVVEDRDIADGGFLGTFSGSGYRAITAALDVIVAH
jgi:hypothetical protein